MKKHVQLPAQERREQIVQAALKVFALKGFDSATNKDIAREAGIASPGLIYHHFQDKASLLRATIESHMDAQSAGFTPESLPGMPLEEGLRLVVRKFLRDINQPGFGAFIRVILGEAMRRPEFAQILSEVLVQKMFTALTAFFQHHIDQGNIRKVDPAVATLRFAGSTMSLLIMREVLRIPAVCAMDLATLEKDLVDDFLKGILPEELPDQI